MAFTTAFTAWPAPLGLAHRLRDFLDQFGLGHLGLPALALLL